MEEKQYVVDALSIEESWRIFRIMAEFVDAIETLSGIKNAVSIFGSARTKPGDPYYAKAEMLARLLAQNGFSRHHRRRSGDHGGGQQGGCRGRRAVPWV